MVIRIAEPGRRAFQLRKGEEGISVFDLEAVEPPLTENEVLGSFRTSSVSVCRSRKEIEEKGLQIVQIPGGEMLPQRLREAHAEIRPGPAMSRAEFKNALRELE